MKVRTVSIDELFPYEGNAKLHPSSQIDQIATSIEEFGNCDPIGVWENDDGELVIVEGHGRYLALKKLGIDKVPVILLDNLTDEQRRAYTLVHNQTAMNTGFDFEILGSELATNDTVDWDDFGFDAIAFATGMSASDEFDGNKYEDSTEPTASVIKVICESEEEKEALKEIIGEQGNLRRMYRVSEL